jgi:hypothetical protein
MDAAIAGMSRVPRCAADTTFSTLTRLFTRLNDGAVANVYTVQLLAGCTHALRIDPRLPLAAQFSHRGTERR